MQYTLIRYNFNLISRSLCYKAIFHYPGIVKIVGTGLSSDKRSLVMKIINQQI